MISPKAASYFVVSSQKLPLNFSLIRKALANDEGFICLGDSNKTNFSIIASQPSGSFFLFKDRLIKNGTTHAITCLKTGISALTDWCYSHTPHKALDFSYHSNLPFHGGVIGFLGFELAHGLESLPKHTKKIIPFPLAGWYHYPAALVYDHQQETLWITAENQQALASYLSHINSLHEKENTLATRELSFTPNMGEKNYHQQFLSVKKHLIRGDAYQINLCESWHSPFAGDAYPLYLELKKQMAVPFGGFIQTPYGDILSFSPEQFIHQSRCGTLTTKPIKGTRPRGKTEKEDHDFQTELSASLKDRTENIMIVDLMRNDLAKVSEVGTVKVEKLCQIESFPNVHHLVSTITSKKRKELHPIDVLLSAFPGGSITGAPKPKVLELIDKLEPIERSIFTGTIAYISACGESDSNIAIRTLLSCENTLYVWAGGGVVIDSNSALEYQEILSKMNWALQHDLRTPEPSPPTEFLTTDHFTA